jgi:hypothetical protein
MQVVRGYKITAAYIAADKGSYLDYGPLVESPAGAAAVTMRRGAVRPAPGSPARYHLASTTLWCGSAWGTAEATAKAAAQRAAAGEQGYVYTGQAAATEATVAPGAAAATPDGGGGDSSRDSWFVPLIVTSTLGCAIALAALGTLAACALRRGPSTLRRGAAADAPFGTTGRMLLEGSHSSSLGLAGSTRALRSHASSPPECCAGSATCGNGSSCGADAPRSLDSRLLSALESAGAGGAIKAAAAGAPAASGSGRRGGAAAQQAQQQRQLSAMMSTTLSLASRPESEGSGIRGLKDTVHAAVQELQGALQADLHEEQLKVFSVIGRGGFGTVYHGAALCKPAGLRRLLAWCALG